MAATLTLEGKILTLTDGDTVTSVDLSAVKGDIGVRGAQGSVNEEDVKQWINEAFNNIPSAEGVGY